MNTIYNFETQASSKPFIYNRQVTQSVSITFAVQSPCIQHMQRTCIYHLLHTMNITIYGLNLYQMLQIRLVSSFKGKWGWGGGWGVKTYQGSMFTCLVCLSLFLNERLIVPSHI